MNIMLRDAEIDEKIEMEKPIYETYLFAFPFNKIELEKSILIQLQKPPDVKFI